MENVKLFLFQKSKFNPVQKVKNKDKNRTCASLLQSLDDGIREFFLCGLDKYGEKIFLFYMHHLLETVD